MACATTAASGSSPARRHSRHGSRRRGFATGAFVGGFPLTKRFGLTPGFDVYDDQMPEHAWRDRDLDAGAARRRRGRPGARLDRQAERQVLRLGARLRSALAVSSAARSFWHSMRSSRITARSRSSIARSGRCSIAWPRLPRPTLVIVTADHGESLGEHGELTHGMFAYEPTLHVPLIVATWSRRTRTRKGW